MAIKEPETVKVTVNVGAYSGMNHENPPQAKLEEGESMFGTRQPGTILKVNEYWKKMINGDN